MSLKREGVPQNSCERAAARPLLSFTPYLRSTFFARLISTTTGFASHDLVSAHSSTQRLKGSLHTAFHCYSDVELCPCIKPLLYSSSPHHIFIFTADRSEVRDATTAFDFWRREIWNPRPILSRATFHPFSHATLLFSQLPGFYQSSEFRPERRCAFPSHISIRPYHNFTLRAAACLDLSHCVTRIVQARASSRHLL